MTAEETKPLPLAGIRVVDFSWIVAGPQATRILADLGAEVIRVENESHLDSTRIGSQLDPENPSYERSGLFNNLNRNKLSITANLYHPKGREVVEALIAQSDVVIENYSAGVFERLGFGWNRLRELNPRIVYVSLSGFGHSGRDSSYVTWGPTAQAISGLTAMSGLPGLPPAGWGFSYLDHTAGFYGAIAVLMALHHRESSGAGQYVDISQIETGMALAGMAMLDYQVNGRAYEPAGNRSSYPALAPHATYRCADAPDGLDRWIAIAAETEQQWRALCEVIGAPELTDDGRFATNAARLQHEKELDEAISRRTSGCDPHELMYRLQARGVPAGAAQRASEKVEDDPQLRFRDFYRRAVHPELGERRFEGVPFRMSAARWQIRRAAPLLGEHTLAVLRDHLDLSEEAIGELLGEAAV